MPIPFNNTYASLPEQFYQRISPAKVPDPQPVKINHGLADELGMDPVWLSSPGGVAMLAGNEIPLGADPISQAYAGHQFGGWVPQLGDGRAVLLGEVVDQFGIRRDIQLKGSGRTMFSRGGDGKATLGSTVREYLVSEAMHALGVPSTRALAVVTTGEVIRRPEPHPGAVFTRVASSHLRVGTFQYFYAQNDIESVKMLADYAITRHYPDLEDTPSPYLSLLEKVADRQAALIARWVQLGFIHGVMNTDNFSIAGETIDFGPCAFMEEFHPDMRFSSIDHHGRYAWGNQAPIGQWNLARLAEALAALIDHDFEKAKPQIEKALNGYVSAFKKAYHRGFCQKLGLDPNHQQAEPFIKATLEMMANARLDFTLFFRQITQCASGLLEEKDIFADHEDAERIQRWLPEWKNIIGDLDAEKIYMMQQSNPVFIPRNHRVEQAIQAAEAGDYQPLHHMAEVWSRPYDEQPENAEMERPAEPHEVVRETFCGT